MIKIDDKKCHGIFVDNKYLVTDIKDSKSQKYPVEFMPLDTQTDAEWKKYIVHGSRSGTIDIANSSEGQYDYYFKQVLGGYLTTRYQCLGLEAHFEASVKDWNFGEYCKVYLHGDVSDYNNLISSLQNEGTLDTDEFKKQCGWFVCVEIGRTLDNLNIRVLTQDGVYKYQQLTISSTKDSISCDIDVRLQRDSMYYYANLDVIARLGSKSTTICSTLLYIVAVDTYLFRPICSCTMSSGSTSNPNSDTLTILPLICKAYSSLSTS